MNSNPISFLVILLFFTGCNPSSKQDQATLSAEENNREEYDTFQQLLDGALVKGAILVYDPQKDVFFSNDFEWCEQGHLPASTFKVPNTIIALETGVAADENALFHWDGQPRRMTAWEQDLTLQEAFHFSCVPCYQEIARKVGTEQMKVWLDKLNYGAMDVHPENIDRFWLEGNSTITPFQQIDFLRRFYYKELPITDQTQSLLKKIMVNESQDDWTLSGKTGWSIREGNNTGWYVGYLEKAGEVYFIATCIQPDEAFNMDMFNIIRRQISIEAFRLMGIIQ